MGLLRHRNAAQTLVPLGHNFVPHLPRVELSGFEALAIGLHLAVDVVERPFRLPEFYLQQVNFQILESLVERVQPRLFLLLGLYLRNLRLDCRLHAECAVQQQIIVFVLEKVVTAVRLMRVLVKIQRVYFALDGPDLALFPAHVRQDDALEVEAAEMRLGGLLDGVERSVGVLQV